LTTPLEKEARRYIFQQYEQRRKDINKAQAEYVIKLLQVLCCKPQELMEVND
jgi:hypothetical protein